MSKLRWTRSPFLILFKGDTRKTEVLGWVCPPWGIHATRRQTGTVTDWTLTHIPTSLQVGNRTSTRAEAQSRAERIDAVNDHGFYRLTDPTTEDAQRTIDEAAKVLGFVRTVPNA